MANVTLNEVGKKYGSVEIIHGVSLNIADGEFVVFVGPSGCGKSTLLRMIAGLEDISSGSIDIGGKVVNDIEPADRGIAMVFQSYALYPHMTVEQNLSFGLRMNGNDKADTVRRVQRAAHILQIEPLMQRRPKQLSGGQRQRVAIGRAIVREPQAFLFDEPLSNLDAELRVQMRVEIARLHKELGTTMVYVTHDQTEAMTLANRIVVLRAGLVEQVGPPLELYNNPANQFVAGFIGSPKMNFMSAIVVGVDDTSTTVQLTKQTRVNLEFPSAKAALKKGDAVSVGVRPEHFVTAGAHGASIALDVDVVEHLGSTSYVYANTATGEQLIIEHDAAQNEKKGQLLQVSVDPLRCYLFSSEGSRII
ncbi:MAG TPA: sn-glycerol-3-phosphate ABC transporter ATP-binding protein UgpC [Ramlibacter sp.]|jgi:lactose/L-arabinose transport system ATP-binding protein